MIIIIITGFPLKHFEQSVHFKKCQKSGPIRSKKWRNFKKGQKSGPIRSKKWRNFKKGKKSGPIRSKKWRKSVQIGENGENRYKSVRIFRKYRIRYEIPIIGTSEFPAWLEGLIFFI